MKTKEELNALKEEVETLNKKLHELTGEELAQVSGGVEPHDFFPWPVVERVVEPGLEPADRTRRLQNIL